MDHFETDLMVSSCVVDSKLLKMTIQFFLIKRWNGFRRFLFGVSPDVPVFKIRVFTNDFELTFIALPI